MKNLLTITLLTFITYCHAQIQVTSFNFLQAGAVPETINEKGANLSTSGLTCNFTHFGKKNFIRMDATWLMRYLFTGDKDPAVFQDSNKLVGLDLPVFTFTFGKNIVRKENFSLGLGINLDSRTFFSSPYQKAQMILDAVNLGVALGLKIKINKFLSYQSITGYDFMFTDNKKEASDGGQIYIQNNLTVLLAGRFGINIQPDLSIKSFNTSNIENAEINNINVKLGFAYFIR